MSDIIKDFISKYPNIVFVILIIICLAFIILILLFLIGFIQNREISIWPPSIGKKPIGENTSCKARSQQQSSTDDCTDDDLLDNENNKLEKRRVVASQKILESKILEISRRKQNSFVLIGSTYLDIILSPISTSTLAAEEWSDLAPLKVAIGGSSMCVGRYLHADYQVKSHLITSMSNFDDFLSLEFKRLYEIESNKWIINDNGLIFCKESVPITVLLKQIDQSYTTMFTHRGSLIEFGWDKIPDKVESLLSSACIIYLSGFIKTNLSLKLVENLKKYHSESLICIDHGRLNLRTDSPSKIKPIYEAFSCGIIDIYICTLDELINFLKISTGKHYEGDKKNARSIIEKIAKNELLPPITIIRYSVGEKSISAFSIVGGIVDSITDHSRKWFDNTPVAPLNAFNAAILYYFSRNQLSSSDDLRGHTIKICQSALDACHKKREYDPSAV